MKYEVEKTKKKIVAMIGIIKIFPETRNNLTVDDQKVLLQL